MNKILWFSFMFVFAGCATQSTRVAKVHELPVCDEKGVAQDCLSSKKAEDLTTLGSPEEITTVEPFFVGMGSRVTDAHDDMERSKSTAPTKARIDKQHEPEFDLPIVINEQVEKWIDYFQGRGRKFFQAWLARSERYVPMMQQILRENGLPQDLIYLAMIESGFKPYAYSRARASGPWQFMKHTGARYGLRADYWIDERRDPEKSTIAAAQHLKDLYDRFDHWYLAAAGYNAGQGKIERAIARYSTEDFWEMTRFSYLKPETKNYVPKMIAAALVAKNKEKYGFTDIEYDEPLRYAKVPITKPTELSVIAKHLQVPLSSLRELNPELLRHMTPPDYPDYELKVPAGYETRFAQLYPLIRKESVDRVAQHRVKRGETLSQIGAKYGVSHQSLMSINRLKSTRIVVGQNLIIPVRGTVSHRAAVQAAAYHPKASGATYRVRSGDTLWKISRVFGVSVTHLREWNNITDAYAIRPGQVLRVAAPDAVTTVATAGQVEKDGNTTWLSYTVQPNETLWSIAKKHGVKPADLMRWNEFDANNVTLFPGDKLRIMALNL